MKVVAALRQRNSRTPRLSFISGHIFRRKEAGAVVRYALAQCHKIVALSQQQKKEYNEAVLKIIAPHVRQHHSPNDTQAPQ